MLQLLCCRYLDYFLIILLLGYSICQLIEFSVCRLIRNEFTKCTVPALLYKPLAFAELHLLFAVFYANVFRYAIDNAKVIRYAINIININIKYQFY